MGMEPAILPDKEIYPIEVSSFLNGLMINSPTGDLNTGIAYQDIFWSDKALKEDNNLLVVESGNTIIRVVYPYLMESLIAPGLGVIICMIFLIYCLASEIRDREKAVHKSEIEDEEEDANADDIKEDAREDTGSEEAADETMAKDAENKDIEKPENKTKYDLKAFDLDFTTGDDFDIPFGKRKK